MRIINGYLEYGNYGDNLLAKIVERKIKRFSPLATFTRLSSQNSFFEHLKNIFACKELIQIGGLYQDKTSVKNILYYSSLVFSAKLLGKRVWMLAQGIGPVNSGLGKFLTFLAFKLADRVSVRDKTSSALLKEWKVDHYHGSDLVWLIDRDEGKLSQESRNKIDALFAPGKFIAISLRQNPNQDDEGLINKVIGSLAKDHSDTPIIIFEMQKSDSRIHALFKHLYYKKHPGSQNFIYVDANDYTAEEIIYMLRTYCSKLIAMRLHALILGHIAGIELVPIACDPKITEFRDQIEFNSLETLREKAAKNFT